MYRFKTILVKSFFIALFSIFISKYELKAQYTHTDSLRGTLNEYRLYDVTKYDLDITIDIPNKSISGYNIITFTATEAHKKIQVDLFNNMQIEKIEMYDKNLSFYRDSNATFITFKKPLKKNESYAIKVYYSGKPIEAINPPWDGGFTFTQTEDSIDWVAVSCEGIGASLWWPCKDHLSDEPESMTIRVTVPENLIAVCNGKFINETHIKETKQKAYKWQVSYPINNYNVTLNVTNYAHFHDIYLSGNDTLNLDYFVLPQNLTKAKTQFEQVKPMLACYEKYFGRFPFWNDGYKLVETPYLGMEHQSCIAYGNNYKKGYNGMDMSGLGFDYIIIHESGHEYWGNAVSMNDIAEMWIHEGFCTYSEGVYVECLHGYTEAMNYYKKQKSMIQNKEPIVGDFGVNDEPHGDMYYKGSLLLNTLRHVINNDSVWWKIIHDFATYKVPRNSSTIEFQDFLQKHTGNRYDAILQQYLFNPKPPKLMYQLIQEGANVKVNYYWEAAVENFDMPIKINIGDKSRWIYPTTAKQTIIINDAIIENISWDQLHFYFLAKKMSE